MTPFWKWEPYAMQAQFNSLKSDAQKQEFLEFSTLDLININCSKYPIKKTVFLEKSPAKESILFSSQKV